MNENKLLIPFMYYYLLIIIIIIIIIIYEAILNKLRKDELLKYEGNIYIIVIYFLFRFCSPTKNIYIYNCKKNNTK